MAITVEAISKLKYTTWNQENKGTFTCLDTLEGDEVRPLNKTNEIDIKTAEDEKCE